MTLQELFELCTAENNGNKLRAAQQFIVRARQEIPNVKMSECMTVAGFNKETEQNFRNSVVIPTRDRIAKIKFNLDKAAVKRLFGRTELTEQESAQKTEIASLLPLRSRTVQEKAMPHIDQFIQ